MSESKNNKDKELEQLLQKLDEIIAQLRRLNDKMDELIDWARRTADHTGAALFPP